MRTRTKAIMLSSRPLKSTLCLGICLLWLGLQPVSAQAARIYVDQAAASGGNGTTWVLAYQTIAQGLSAATSGDEIWVAEGTYFESITWSTTKNGVLLYGSFDKTEVVIGDRDIQANFSVVDASTADAGGPADHVFNLVDGVSNIRIDGFMVTGGVANGSSPHNRGGGIYAFHQFFAGTNNVVANCTVIGNESNYGSGIYMYNTQIDLIDCDILYNVSTGSGGGVVFFSAMGDISGCLFKGNYAESFAAGLDSVDQYSLITNCRFEDNYAEIEAGAIFLSDSSPTITDCVFLRNLAINQGGGGISAAWGGNAVISNCFFSDNGGGNVTLSGTLDLNVNCDAVISDCIIQGTQDGPGMVIAGANPTITDCEILSNEDGGLFLFAEATGVLTNVKISGNTGPFGGGGVAMDASSPVFINCAITGNEARIYPAYGHGDEGGGVYCEDGASPVFRNCTISYNKGSEAGGAWIGVDYYGFGECHPEFYNTIFSNNTLRAIRAVDRESTPLLINCLFYGNDAGDYLDDENSEVYGGAEEITLNVPYAEGNVDGAPLFVNGISGTWTAAATYDTTRNRTLLIDAVASFTPDALVGEIINADTSQKFEAVVTSNTLTALEVIGDLTAIAGNGDTYQIKDYHLSDGSAALDRGKLSAAPAADIDGDPRPGTDALVDIGIDEADPTYVPPADSVAPASRVQDVVDVSYSGQVYVPYVASDVGSGIQSVKLYYRKDGGAWTDYGGNFAASPILFDASFTGGFGYYEFYSIATDNSSNVEPGKTVAEDDVRIVPGGFPSRILVDRDATGTETGVAWSGAFHTISKALRVAKVNHVPEVWVAEGIYQEALVLHSDVALYGGFQGTESALSERPMALTVIDGARADGGDEADHVVILDGVTNVRLDGFGITGGRADAYNYRRMGGGVFGRDLDNSTVIANCRIVRNSAQTQFGSGGGIYLLRSAPVIESTRVIGNYVYSQGGGIYCRESAPEIINCEIVQNQITSTNGGGGIRCYLGSPLILNSTISDNEDVGIALNNTAEPTITNCIVSGNEGQGIYEASETCDADVSYSLLHGNGIGDYHDHDTSADYTGAAAIMAAVPHVTNLADGDPAFATNITGTWTEYYQQNATDHTTLLTDAAASFVPGSLVGKTINPFTLFSSHYLIVANTANTITINGFDYSWPGDSYEIYDFSLTGNSAALDAGTSIGAPGFDIDGTPRPYDLPGVGFDGAGEGFDLGAYELISFANINVTVPGDPIDFGNWGVTSGVSPSQSATISNTGLVNLGFTGAGIAITGANASEFLFVGGVDTSPIAPSGSREIQVAFDPDFPGPKSAYLTITTDDPDEGTINIELIGVAGPSGVAGSRTWTLYE